MKISCPSCSAKYSIADEKVNQRLAKIRCRKCGATIVIDGKVSPPKVTTADRAGGDVSAAVETGGPGAGGNATYSVDFADNDQRNLTAAQIVAACRRGEMTTDTFVWMEGFDDWKPVNMVPELMNALQAAGATSPQTATGPRAAVAAAAPDLFGGIDKAGSEEDVTTSAPPDDPPAPEVLGARNESSVLFSLSALTATSAMTATSSSSATTASGDDSGLIDLKAITMAQESEQAAAEVAPIAPLGMAAPLGLAAPLGAPAPAMAAPIAPPPKSKNGLYIVGGMVAAAAIVAIAIVSTSEKEPPPPQPVVAPLPIATTPMPTRTVEAKAPATGTADEDDEKKKRKYTAAQKARWRRLARKKKAEQEASESGGDATGASTTRKKKRSKSKCGCAPGDLRCAMRCAAGD